MMNYKKYNWFMLGLFIGLVIVGGIFALTQAPTVIEVPQKMSECINAGGQFSMRDWSWEDDNSDYRMRCVLPEREMFNIPLKKTLTKIK